MPIIRRKKTSYYTHVPNEVFDDERLRADETGILCYLLSRPDHWEIQRSQLGRRFQVGRESMRRIVHNLICCGWMRAESRRGADGRISYWYEITDNQGPPVDPAQVRDMLSIADTAEQPVNGAVEDEQEAAAEYSTADGSPLTAHRRRQAVGGLYIESATTELATTHPPKGAGARANEAFLQIASAWQQAGGSVLSPSEAEQLYIRLSEAEQAAAMDGLKPYFTDCARASRKTCDFSTYLRGKRWQKLDTPAAQDKLVPVKNFSPAWHAWRKHRIATGQSVSWMDDCARARPNGDFPFPSEWPPALPKAAEG